MDTRSPDAARVFLARKSRIESRFARHSSRIRLTLLVALLAWMIPTGSAFAQTVHIEGTYDVYDWNYSRVVPWTTMTIYDQNDNGFSVKGNGWTGHGTLQWMSGSYEWTYSDGKTRRTTFSVRTNGIIDGVVKDEHDPRKQFNWEFYAKGQVKPQASSTKECDRVRNEALPACARKGTPAEQFTCTNDTYVRWLGCLDSIPLSH